MYGLPGAGDFDDEGESGRCRAAADSAHQQAPLARTTAATVQETCLVNTLLCGQHRQVQTFLLRVATAATGICH